MDKELFWHAVVLVFACIGVIACFIAAFHGIGVN